MATETQSETPTGEHNHNQEPWYTKPDGAGNSNGNGDGHQHAHPHESQHDAEVDELPDHLKEYLTKLEKKLGGPAPDSLVKEIKAKIAQGYKVEVSEVEVCGRPNCPEHKGKNGLLEVLGKILGKEGNHTILGLEDILKGGFEGDLKEVINGLARGAKQMAAERESEKREKKIGTKFYGKATCVMCFDAGKGINVLATRALLNMDKIDDHGQVDESDAQPFARPVCESCFEAIGRGLGEGLQARLRAPCVMCVAQPTEDGTPPAWGVLCDLHYNFAKAVRA